MNTSKTLAQIIEQDHKDYAATEETTRKMAMTLHCPSMISCSTPALPTPAFASQL